MKLILLLLLSSTIHATSTNNYFTRERNLKRNLPFSESVKVGNTLYLSGAIGIKPGTKAVVKGGIKAETAQALSNIKEVLEHHKLDLSNIVKCQVMLRDMKDFKDFNSEYRKYFKSPYPARSTYGVSWLVLKAKVEIECLAVFPEKKA